MAGDTGSPSPLLFALALQRGVATAAADAAASAVVAPERLREAADVEVGTTSSEVVYTENKLELRRYEPLTGEQAEVPLVVVYALINRPFVLDLQRDRSVVRRLLEAGHDVYLVDWNEPSRLDRHLTLDDYVGRYLDNCVDAVREDSGGGPVNLLGYCMGGTMSAAYAALHPEKVNALGLMAAGLYFEDTGGVLELWGDEAHYDPRTVTDTWGNVPAEFLAAGFAMMDPVSNYVAKYLRLFDSLENEDFVANFARMERWLGEGIDLAGEAYAEFVEEIYQDNSLWRGDLEIAGERVDPGEITAPILQIVGEYDTLVPAAASLPFEDVVGSPETTVIEYPTGHVGLSVSRSTHRDVWPEVAEWFHEQSAPALADAVGEAVEEVLGYDVETDVTAGDAGELEVAVAGEEGELARSVVERSPDGVVGFLEDALGVEIGVERRDRGVAVTLFHDDTTDTVVVESPGAAIREEVAEAVASTDLAGSYELEDVEGVGPTYAGRLRAAGIDSVRGLADADADSVAEVIDSTTGQARRIVRAARERLDR